MAKNRAHADARQLHMNVSAINGSGAADLCKSGDPGVIGRLPVVCLTDEDANGEATIDNGGSYYFNVHKVSAGTMVPGDAVHWDNTAGELRDSGAGVFFGTLVGKTSIPTTQTVLVEVKLGA